MRLSISTNSCTRKRTVSIARCATMRLSYNNVMCGVNCRRDAPSQSGLRHRLCKRVVKQHQHFVFVGRPQDERPFAAPAMAAEASSAIERDVELRHADGIASFAGCRHQLPRQVWTLAKAVQRHMQAIGGNGLRSQSGRPAKPVRKMGNPRRVRGGGSSEKTAGASDPRLLQFPENQVAPDTSRTLLNGKRYRTYHEH